VARRAAPEVHVGEKIGSILKACRERASRLRLGGAVGVDVLATTAT
jgi:hypothetical protein